MNKIDNIHFDFLKSALEKKDIANTVDWIQKQNEAVEVSIKK